MLIVAHANHPEMFVAGIVVGVLLTLAQMAVRRVGKR
jgi:TRAP-type C4-dicarboxylate transport system permease large subunit